MGSLFDYIWDSAIVKLEQIVRSESSAVCERPENDAPVLVALSSSQERLPQPGNALFPPFLKETQLC